MGLKVVIVGGGIAGFSCAISLRRAGHDVHIYERSAFNNEVGAAIHIPPNSSRGLLAWGMDPDRSRLVPVKQSYHVDGSTMNTSLESDLRYITARYGAPWFFSHRVDFHDELKRLATEPGAVGTPATVRLKAEVVQYKSHPASVVLANGDSISADLVVAADGIHSIGVEAVLGHRNPPQVQEHYNMCYRFLIPAEDLEEDPVAKFLNENDDGRIKFLVGTNKRLVSYPCRNNEVHNFVALFHDDEIDSSRSEDWLAPADKSHLLKLFNDFHPKIQAVLSKAGEVKQWPLLYRPPLPTWRKGRMVLVGDAAHPMLPHQGQGGAQGVEDGIALGIFMAGAKPEDVPKRLELFEETRRVRASVIQVLSNAGQDESERIRTEASQLIPADTVPRNPKECFDYNFDYDIIRECVLKMKEENSLFELPNGFFKQRPS